MPIFQPGAGEGGGSGAGAAEFLNASIVAGGAVAAAGRADFNTVNDSLGSDISLNTGTGVFTLAAGKTYRCTAGLSATHAALGDLTFQWRDNTGAVLFGGAATNPTVNTAASVSPLPTVEGYITPTVSTDVELRITGLTGGAVTAHAGWASIETVVR